MNRAIEWVRWCGLAAAAMTAWGCGSGGSHGQTGTAVRSQTLMTGVLDLSAAGDDSCALMGDRTVQCWGDDSYGQIGDGTIGADRLTPTPVAGLGNVVSLSVGGQFACAVEGDGSVWCWGRDDLGQLGDGKPDWHQNSPVRLAISSAVQVAAGGSHACALINDGTVQCWGYNHWGQVGYGGQGETWNTPIVVGFQTGVLTNVARVVTGGLNSCAILNDASVRCWGNNYYGSALFSGYDYALSPQPAHLGPVSELSLSIYFGCAKLLADGTVWCWGSNYSGQLGTGNTEYSQFDHTVDPAEMTGDAAYGTNLAGLSLGANFGVATRSDGALVAWGGEYDGELADGDNVGVDTSSCFDHPNSCRAHPIPTYWSITKVVAGGYHACALRYDGAVICWGSNAHGQLGNGSTTNSAVPVTVAGGAQSSCGNGVCEPGEDGTSCGQDCCDATTDCAQTQQNQGVYYCRNMYYYDWTVGYAHWFGFTWLTANDALNQCNQDWQAQPGPNQTQYQCGGHQGACVSVPGGYS